MSRKPRQRITPELVPDGLPSEPVGEDRPTVHELTGKLNDMLEAIVSACAIVDTVGAVPPLLDAPPDDTPRPFKLTTPDDLPDDESLEEDLYDDIDDDIDDDLDDDLDDDIADEELDPGTAELGEAFAGITLTTRVLARGLLSRVLDGPPEASPWPTPSATGHAAETQLFDELTRTLLPANLPKSLRISRADRREALDEAASLIHEVGLEDFGVWCDLVTLGGTRALATSPASPEGAHIALLEFLFERAEAVVEDLDPLLAVERDASFWEFSRWSASPPPGAMVGEVADFSRTVREQEYSLADRNTIALGTSVIAELARDSGFAELFPRQHRMATALTESVVDVFDIVSREGVRTTFRSLSDNRTFQVREHMDEIQYRSGWIAAGRLLPFDDDTYLRSPGMLFFKPQLAEETRAATRLFDGMRATMTPSLAIEAFISSAMFGVPVPREVKPARSRGDARTLLEMIDDIVADAELDEESVSSDLYYVPGHRTETSSPHSGIRLDSTVQGYMAALERQATGGGQGRQQRARTPKRRGKRRR